MERTEIRGVVLKYLDRALDGIDHENVDTNKSMIDLGATSLDIVEVVSSSMRELRIKIPRSELNNLKNIDELVDMLHTKKEEKAGASTR